MRRFVRVQAQVRVSSRRLPNGWKGNSDRKSTRLNSSHSQISYAVFCLKKKKTKVPRITVNIRQAKANDRPGFPIAAVREAAPSSVRPYRIEAGDPATILLSPFYHLDQ